MAESKVKDILSAVPAPVWFGLIGLVAAGSVWGDAKQAARELGKNTGEALREVAASKDKLLNLPEFQAGYFSKLNGKRFVLMKAANVNKFVAELASAKGFFNDNEDALWHVLNNIATRTQLAQVAQAFDKAEGKNLGAYLISFTNTNERHAIQKRINQMQSGIL